MLSDKVDKKVTIKPGKPGKQKSGNHFPVKNHSAAPAATICQFFCKKAAEFLDITSHKISPAASDGTSQTGMIFALTSTFIKQIIRGR
jgi:hypothetical protein